MWRELVAVVLSLGCGGGTTAIYGADHAPGPFVGQVHAYRAPERCGAGPWELRFHGLGSANAERYAVVACSPRPLHAFQNDRSIPIPDATGAAEANVTCQPSSGEAVAWQGSDAGQGSGAGDWAGAGGVGGASAGAIRLEEVPLPEGDPDTICERLGLIQVSVYPRGLFINTRDPPLPFDGEETVRFWSRRPNDLSGVIFLLRQEAYAGSREAMVRYRKHLDALPSAEPRDDQRPPEAPPPPREEAVPPKPTLRAEWIRGYWIRSGKAWGWVAGSWRVPEGDEPLPAPKEPPPLRAESAPGPEFQGAIWQPGYWAWDGAAFLWIAGRWSMPPRPGARWRAPRWRPSPRGVVLVPGAWL